jgi:hypothetical protein
MLNDLKEIKIVLFRKIKIDLSKKKKKKKKVKCYRDQKSYDAVSSPCNYRISIRICDEFNHLVALS